MAITTFIPELWAAAIELPFEKALVYGQPTVVNRKYEGMIREMGDTVHIGGITDPTVRSYDRTTDLTTEDLTTTDQTLVIDQGDYFSFRVNDVDKVQAAGDFQGPATNRAAYGMRDEVDRYIAGLHTGVDAGNDLGDVAVADGDAAWQLLVDLSITLDEANVPDQGRYVIVPPAFHGKILTNDKFVRVDASGTSEGLRNAIVGRAAGFDILKSNNTPFTPAGVDPETEPATNVIMAGIPDALSFAMQITQTEALRAQNRFADIVRGLQIYGAKLTEPTGIATATVSFG